MHHGIAFTTLVAGVLSSAVALPAQETTEPVYRFGGVDIYGTDAIAVAEFGTRFGGRARALLDAVQQNDGAAVDTIAQSMSGEIRRLADFAWIDMALIYDPSDTTAYMTFDVVERADSVRRMSFAPVPAGQVEDPAGLLALWRAYEDTVLQRMIRGQMPPKPTPADCPALHCVGAFGADPTVGRYERAFVTDAPRHTAMLLRVLREDADEADRGAAAYLLAHAAEPDSAVAALVAAMRDPSARVRNNATRVLMMAATLRAELDVPLEPVLESIDSPTTTSRNKALYLLAALSLRPELHDRIRRQAAPTLLRLLRLIQPNNHHPAYLVLKNISGESFGDRDYDAWERWLQRAGAL
jgi:hypothetical protein